jgi:Ca2+-binding RTX toxin-like protein
MIGGAGNDTIDGGLDNDYLTGGAVPTTFRVVRATTFS